jgi:hypothetical protein
VKVAHFLVDAMLALLCTVVTLYPSAWLAVWIANKEVFEDHVFARVLSLCWPPMAVGLNLLAGKLIGVRVRICVGVQIWGLILIASKWAL